MDRFCAIAFSCRSVDIQQEMGEQIWQSTEKGGTDDFHETRYVQPRRDWSKKAKRTSRCVGSSSAATAAEADRIEVDDGVE